MTATRRRLVLAAALAIAAILAWRWHGSSDPAPRTRDAGPPPAPPRPAAVREPSVVDPHDLADLNQQLQDPAQVATYLERYKEANRYPHTTLPLLPEMRDALDPDQRFATDTPAPWVRNLYTRPPYRVYYRLETDKVRYVAPEPIELALAVFRGDQQRAPVEIEVGPVTVRRVDPAGQLVGLDTATLVRRSPGTYAVSYAPPRRGGVSDDVVLQLEVTWKLADGTGKPVPDRVLVHYTPAPPAAFTGRFTDQLHDGSLRVDVEVGALREGNARIAAQLFGRGGEVPVASAFTIAALPRGRSWVTLDFYGLVVRDRDVPGPYVIKGLRGHFPSTTSAGRGGEMARFTGSHATRDYPLSAFTSQVWDSPEKRAGIAAYEAELARLRAGTPAPP